MQQLFPIQILLPFPIFKLPPNFIFQCYRPQTWQFYLFFPALSVSSIQKVPGIKFKGGEVNWVLAAKGLFMWRECAGENKFICNKKKSNHNSCQTRCTQSVLFLTRCMHFQLSQTILEMWELYNLYIRCKLQDSLGVGCNLHKNAWQLQARKFEVSHGWNLLLDTDKNKYK